MSEVMQAMWSPRIIDWIFLSVLLLVGHFLKRKIPFFNKFLLPSSIIAGFLGLLLGPEVLRLIPFEIERLGVYVYHLLGLGFIALSLKERPITTSRPVIKTSLFIITTYLIQGIVGVGLTILAAATFLPDLFPSMGMFLALGFGQGPGQAYSVGMAWQESGVSNAAGIGLTIATIGFLWATFGGVIMANVLKKRYKPSAMIEEGADSPIPVAHLFGEPESPEEERGEITLGNMIDLGTRQLFLIGIIYLAVYGTLRGVGTLLEGIGPAGANLANVLWGFHFVFGTIYAIIIRLVMNKLKKTGIMRHQYNNNRILSRISGTSFDFMVAASIAAISIDVVLDYWHILLIITTLGGILTWWFSELVARRVFKQNILEYALVFFGTYTGTLSTGMALLRTVDPAFKTPVADNVVLGSGLALFLAIPLLLVINVPILGVGQPGWGYHFLALGAMVLYCIATSFFLFYERKARKV